MTATTNAPRLKQRYREEIAGKLKDEFSYENVMQIPGLTKIVVNMGVGDAARDSKLIEGAIKDLTTITGQKPAVTKARKSIAQFKLREGQPIGAHVTLRGDACGSSWTACCRSRCRASATSVVCPRSSSTVGATTPSVSRSRSCSTRSTRTRSTGSGAWTSPWSPRVQRR